MKSEYKVTLTDRTVYFRADVLSEPIPTPNIESMNWNPIELVYKHNDRATRMIQQQLDRQHADKDFTTSKFDITINDWLLEGCYIKSLEFADQDVNDRDNVNICVIIRADNITAIGSTQQ